jgi:hypothetical protein
MPILSEDSATTESENDSADALEKSGKHKKNKQKKMKKDKKQKKRRVRRTQKKQKKDKRDKKHKKVKKEVATSHTSESDGEYEKMSDIITRSPMPAADHMLKGFADLFENALAKNPKKGVFIDFYGGAGKIAARAESKYGLIGICIDTQAHAAWNLHTEGVVPYIAKKLSSGKVKGSHIATDCRSFTSARHGKAGDNCPKPLRDYGENAWGLPDLCEKDQAALELGNKDARLTIELIDLHEKHHVPVSVENGHNTILWHLPEMAEKLENARIFRVDYCMMGRTYRKRTRLAAWGLKNTQLADQMEKQCGEMYHCLSKKGVCCSSGQPHVILRGWVRGKALASQGKVYPRKFANFIAKLLLG